MLKNVGSIDTISGMVSAFPQDQNFLAMTVSRRTRSCHDCTNDFHEYQDLGAILRKSAAVGFAGVSAARNATMKLGW